jgi:hypothetical protein
MALTKVTSGAVSGLATSATTDTTDASNITTGTIPTARLDSTLDLSSKTVTLPAASVTAHATTPTLDSPSITGTLSVDSGGTVSHTVANWSDDITYVITPTNCTVGSINTSGIFVVTHTSGSPSYTIKATTDSLGLADSSLVTKNIVMNLSAPTLSSPADVGTATDVVYTITSTDSNDDKLILDMGSSNFTYSSVSVGTASKVGNTVECIGFTTNNPAVTIQFTAEATYSVTAKSVNIAGTYGDSALSSADSITISNGYSVDYLVVAGGGGGGGGYGGGGGAGGYRNSYNSETSGASSSSESAISVTAGSVYTITVGAGGQGGYSDDASVDPGQDSSIVGLGVSITSTGGGEGQGRRNTGSSGGSGGGNSYTPSAIGYSGTANQGGNGGNGSGASANGRGGGGGGASGTGGTGTSSQSGHGANGLSSSITGSAVTRAGGGGGGAQSSSGSPGTGGTGGGGNGSESTSTGGSGSANTGGGGGGGGGLTGNSGAGGSGVVILRVATADYSGTTSGSPSVTTSGSDTILTFNGDGSYTA